MPNTTRYNSGRAPVIALDYDSRFIAHKKELLVDYKKGKLYVVSAEDKSVIIDITANIINEFTSSGSIADNFIVNIEGVGEINLTKAINRIYKNNITLKENDEAHYLSPTLRFDNRSITVQDTEVGISNFKVAGNNTYPVKFDNVIKWVPRIDEDVVRRVTRLETLAPPDAEEFKRLRKQIADIQVTADLYADLPAIKTLSDSNRNRLDVLDTKILKTAEIDPIKTDISGLKSDTQAMNNRLTTLESKEDTEPKFTALDRRITAIEAQSAAFTKITDLQVKVQTLLAKPDLEPKVTELTNKVNTISSSFETLKSNTESKLSAIEGNTNRTTSEVSAISGRLNTLEGLNIAKFKADYDTRIATLEAVPNFTSNITNLESQNSVLTNSVNILKTQVSGLMLAEDLTPRVSALEREKVTAKNVTMPAEKVHLPSGDPEANKIYPYTIHSFDSQDSNVEFKIQRSGTRDTTLWIDLFIDFTNSSVTTRKILKFTKPDNNNLYVYIPPTNKKIHLKMMSYDSGISWFYNYEYEMGIADQGTV